MVLEVKIGDRTAFVEVFEKDGKTLSVKIDESEYQVDIAKVEKGTYTVIHDNKSIELELEQAGSIKKYLVHSEKNTYNVKIIDTEEKYLQTRQSNNGESGDNYIVSPIPGKVVKLLVKEGDPVKEGDTVIIISAMKMESEYKAPLDGVIKKIYVKESETIEGNQPLVFIE